MDAALGLLLLAVYIVAIVSLAAAITFGVIRIFPTERRPKGDEPEAKEARPESSPANGGAGGGSLFRRSKRGRRA